MHPADVEPPHVWIAEVDHSVPERDNEHVSVCRTVMYRVPIAGLCWSKCSSSRMSLSGATLFIRQAFHIHVSAACEATAVQLAVLHGLPYASVIEMPGRR